MDWNVSIFCPCSKRFPKLRDIVNSSNTNNNQYNHICVHCPNKNSLMPIIAASKRWTKIWESASSWLLGERVFVSLGFSLSTCFPNVIIMSFSQVILASFSAGNANISVLFSLTRGKFCQLPGTFVDPETFHHIPLPLSPIVCPFRLLVKYSSQTMSTVYALHHIFQWMEERCLHNCQMFLR